MYRILIVDDLASDRRLISELLHKSYNCVIVETSHGDAALEEINRADFDCILLDYSLGESCGLDVLKSIRMTSQIPVVVVTAMGSEQLAVDMMKAGADDYIKKDDLSHLPHIVLELSLRHRAFVERLNTLTTKASELAEVKMESEYGQP